MPIPEHINTLLADMEADAERVSQETEDHWVRARSLRPDAARLLLMLASAANAQAILEIGTSVGYSTVHLALAAQETGGHVTTLELMPSKYEQAAANLARGGLSGFVTQKQGDARELLASLPGPWDLVFVDAEKDVYLDTWQLFKNHVRPGGLVVADNALSHAADLAGYIDAIRADGRYDTLTLPVGQGLELSYRRR
jgi:predicted O-methyltransferase YrrM